MRMSVFKLPPLHYMHVEDCNANIVRVEIGPQTFIKKDHENVVLGPTKMVMIPPQSYCEVKDPVIRDPVTKAILYDDHGEARIKYGDYEVRYNQAPFPLYPGESLRKKPSPMPILDCNSSFLLKAECDLTAEESNDGKPKAAGDEWLFVGPGVYEPKRGIQNCRLVKATVINNGEALRLRARREFRDRNNIDRVTGEEWHVRQEGSYLPDAYEEIVSCDKAFVITDTTAVHVRAIKSFTDHFKKNRKNGEEYLITIKDTDSFIPSVYEEVVESIDIITLSNRQFCTILDPVDSKGRPQLGQKRLVEGPASFFLMPGESLESGIEEVIVLDAQQGIVLRANEEFVDDTNKKRLPGDLWLIRGPTEIIPPPQVSVLERRTAIALDENEGVYVRDKRSGNVQAIIGRSYMLSEHEELWDKTLPPDTEALLFPAGRYSDSDESAAAPPLQSISFGTTNVAPQERCVKKRAMAYTVMEDEQTQRKPVAQANRDKTRVVTFRVPHNSAVQIYDYKEKTARVVFGPNLVMLGPEEHFTQLSLSGGKPKRPNVIKSLLLLLGPDFCTDIVNVETSDHARLALQLSYNWRFQVNDEMKPPYTNEQGRRLFSVPDFVGDACKALASRIRGHVAAIAFDDFHKHSARIIRQSIFGVNAENGRCRDHYQFPQNNLLITNVDIQSVEPIDQKTRESLQKSVQMAIEITTKAQEATARHEAERLEQEAKGRLDRQIIDDEARAEQARFHLLELQALSAAVESTGQAKAEAQSASERAKIEGEAAVEQAKLRAEANRIEAARELERVTACQAEELDYLARKNELEIRRQQRLTDLEIESYEKMLGALGSDTLKAVAMAGPAADVRLLEGLGLKSVLLTDGHTPINLFGTARSLIGKAMGAKSSG